MGHGSKSILERIVSEVSLATKLNQWRSTSVVIDWFKNIPDKSRSIFIKFDVCNFYPSISESLLDRSIAFARTCTTVSESDIAIIKHARKSLLFSKSGEWVKKDTNLFDFTMGSFDGAEVCELVGLYILSKLQALLGQANVGLYRDDGLAVV